MVVTRDEKLIFNNHVNEVCWCLLIKLILRKKYEKLCKTQLN